MASNIKFKRSAVQNRVPTTAQLELGELALNTYDGKLYTEINTGSAAVVEIGSKLSSLVVDGDNGAGNGDVTFHGATAGRDVTWDHSTNFMNFADNAYLSFGASNDLQIVHNGGQSIIQDSGTGSLNLLGNNVTLANASGTEDYIRCYHNSSIDLYFNNNIRVTTTDDGADIFGTGSLKIPVGTTAQRSASPTNGDLRYNSTTGGFEGYSSGGWGELGGGGVGIGSTSINPGSGVVGGRIGVGFTDINFVGAGLSVTGYGSTVVVDISDAVSRRYGRNVYTYTATEGQTTFTGLSYTNATIQISVYLNGARLSASAYTATSGHTVVLATGASVGDNVEILELFSGVDLSRTLHSFTATAGQTTFTGLSYLKKKDLDVYLNGIRLSQTDYTATDGASIVLSLGASVNDLIEVIDMGAGATWTVGGTEPEDVYRLDGGVGIGTSNPTDKLNVIGNARIVGILTVGTGSVTIDNTTVKTGSTNVHNVGVELAGINVLGADTPIGVGVTIYNSGGALFAGTSGIVTATAFHGALTGNVTGTASNASGATGDFSIADKIIHTGDTNTALRFPSADTIAAETGGTERLRIDSNGHVTIGIAANTVTSGYLQIPRYSGDGNCIELHSLRNDTAPADLAFYKNRSTSYGSYSATQSGDTIMSIASYASSGAAYALKGLYQTYLSGSGVDYAWKTATGSGAEKMRLLQNGNLGIGTVSPQERLHLYGGNCALEVDAPADRYCAVGFSVEGVSKWWMGRGDSDILSETSFFIGKDAGSAVDKGGNSAKFVIDADGRILAGTTSSSTNTRAIIQGRSDNANTTGTLHLQRGASNPAGNSGLGRIIFADSASAEGAFIWAQAESQWASGDYPTTLKFGTTADAGSNATARLTITSAGRWIQGASENINMDNNASGQLTLSGQGYKSGFAMNASGLQIYHNAIGKDIIFGPNETEKMRLYSNGNLNIAGDVTVNGDELFIADSIKHIGDTDTAISFPSNDTIRFSTGGTARVTVTDATTTVANNLTVTGNFQVDGTNTVVNSTTMTVDDKNIVLGSGAANDAAADGGGITLESGDGNKTWNWVDATDAWTSSEHIALASGKKVYLTDTNTALSEGSTNTLRITTDSGYVDIGPKNTSWCHFHTDRASFYFAQNASFNGAVSPYGDSTHNIGASGNRWANIYGDTLHGGRMTLSDDGSASPTLLIAGDDQNPWGIQVRNDTYATGNEGLKIYQSNAGVSYLQTRGTSARGRLIMQQHNGTTTNNMIEFTEGGAVDIDYQGSSKLTTTNTGVTITGTCTATTFSGSGASLTNVNATTLDSIDSASFLRSDANDTSSGTIAFGTGALDPDSFGSYSGGFGNIADGGGWGVRGLFVHGGTAGEAAAIGHNSDKLYFGIQDGSSANSMETWLDVTPGTRVINFQTDNNATNVQIGGNKIFHAGNDGTGSGLDADLLDGVQGASYLRSDAEDSSSAPLNINGGTANASNDATLYVTSTNNNDWGLKVNKYNGSATEYGVMIDVASSSNHALRIRGNQSEVFRVSGNGTVTAGGSNTVWHAGNDGSGSGLDADTLDGVQGGSYLRSDAGDSFTGGTLTIAGGNDIRFSNGGWSGESTKIQHHSNWLYMIGGSNGFIFRHTDGSNRWQINSSGHLFPSSNTTYDLGTSSYKINNGYFNWLYSDAANRTSTKPTRFTASDDAWLRYYDGQYFRMWLGLSAKTNNYGRLDSTTDSNYWVGAAGWGTTSMNDLMGKGNVFWDTWSNPNGQPSGTSHWTGFNCLHYTNRGTDGTSSGGAYGWQMTMGAGNPSLLYVRGNWSSGNLGTPTWYKVWNEANDGSGSGLDADTVDGIQGGSFLRTDTNDNVIGGPWQLTNTGTTNWGFRFVNSTGTNNSVYMAHGTHGMHIRNDSAGTGNYLLQVYGSNGTDFKVRGGDALVTSGGNTMWHAGNDGSGSGLDADKLDNIEASGFVKQDNNSFHVLRFGSGSNSGHTRTSYPYAIFQETGAWSTPYPDLCINYHTGIKIGCGNQSYGGLRFTPDYNSETILMSINNGTETNGNGNVLVNCELYCDRWFRNNDSGEGMYNDASTQHWYSDNDDIWNIAGGTASNSIRFRDENAGTTRGYVFANNGNQIGFLNPSGGWQLMSNNASSLVAKYHIIPWYDDNYDLGFSNLRWDDIFATNGTIQTSDERLKQDIASLTTAEMKAAKRLSALFKTYRWKDAVVKKGTDKARTHTGIIAQQIVAAMEAEGLDYAKYAFICYNEWYENDEGKVINFDEAYNHDVKDSSNLDGYVKTGRFSVRYTELLSFIAAYNEQRFTSIESRLSALEGS